MDPSRTDFDNSVKTVTFEPSVSQLEETVIISLVDDSVNEADEGFIIIVKLVEIGTLDDQNLSLERNGVALVRIVDDDCKIFTLISI